MADAETGPLENEDENITLDDQGQGDGGQTDQDDQDDDQLEDGEAEGSEGGDQDDEFEITLEGDDGSHPKQDDNHGVRKRINKLNSKVAEAVEGKDAISKDLEVERERNRLLQLALEQQSGTPKGDGGPPDPNDFDAGIADPEYAKAFRGYLSAGVMAETKDAQTQTKAQDEEQSQLRARQVEHYQRAESLKVRDYDETEDKAISALGNDAVNQLIANSNKSAEILYYLGKNPDKANDLARLLQASPVKAVLQLGRLEAQLKAVPKAKRNAPPNPDGEMTGGGSGRKRSERGPKGATFT